METSLPSLFLAAVGAAVIAAVVNAEVTCPADWTPFEASESCIRFYDVSVDWFAARAACQDEDADLVKIISQDMNDLIEEIAETFDRESYPWIGLNDQSVEGSWVWTDGTEPTFKYWMAGYPGEGSTAEGRDCAQMDYIDSYAEWYDWDCYDPDYTSYVCEIFPADGVVG